MIFASYTDPTFYTDFGLFYTEKCCYPLLFYIFLLYIRGMERRKIRRTGGVYEVDPDGNVWRDGYVLTQRDRRSVMLYHDGWYHTARVADLVAEAFVHNPDPGRNRYVVHVNNDIRDNRSVNLRWSERAESKRPGTRVMREDCKVYRSVADAARDTPGASRIGIYRCIRGEQEKSGGVRWFRY